MAALHVSQVDIVGVDAEVQREYARHREHLERNVASLKRKLAQDSVVHHADNVKIMQVTETRLLRKDYWVRWISVSVCPKLFSYDLWIWFHSHL